MKYTTDIVTGLIGIAALTVIAVAPNASAQEASSMSEFERPFGYGYGQESQPYSAGSRDLHNNRVIVNGLIEGGTGLGLSLNTGWGQTDGGYGMIGTGTAVGNQLNVITNGNNNTVIIDSTQINNGDQNVFLNGELNLND